MKPAQTHQIYEFGDFELDALRRKLISRVDGQEQQISGRAFDMLLYLVERPGQLLDKRVLIDALWPNVIVEEGNLSQTVHTLRRVLGERPGEHRYIVTVAGRGYRFVADVKSRTGSEPPLVEETPPPTVGEVRSHWHKLIPVAAASSVMLLVIVAWLMVRGREQSADEPSARAMPSIAVLPFADMSAEQNQTYFADGLSEEILNLLSQSDALRVIARTSSFSFKDQSVDLATIARRLDVTHVLEGSVRKSGDRLRITAQLIDGATSSHIWSQTYDRDVQDIFRVQSEIAASVANSLNITLGNRAGAKQGETTNAEAYERYVQGRHFFNRRSGTDLLRAKDYFEQAVRLDPGYGRAWAALAGVYLVAPGEDVQLPEDAQAKWREAVERAVALAPDLAEANMRAAQYYWNHGDHAAARRLVDKATEASPSDPLLLGLLMSRALIEGRMEDALMLQRRVTATDPISAVNRANLGAQLMAMGQYVAAQVELEKALELSPALPQLKAAIAQVLILQNRVDDAFTVIQGMPAGWLRDRVLAFAYYTRGDLVESDAALARLIEAGKLADSHHQIAMAIGEVFAMREDRNQAFTWLSVAHQRSGVKRTLDGDWAAELHLSPFLKQLRSDSRWQPLLNSAQEEYARFPTRVPLSGP